MSVHIVADIGGTQMRAAAYLPDTLNPIRIERISTQAPNTTPLERLVTLFSSIWPEDGQVAAIALAVPGPVNPFQGILYTAPNIPGWNNLHLVKHLEEKFAVPVLLGNDANLAALGEWRFGAGRGHHHLIYLTISTGIGGGVIIDDGLLLGADGLAAELGHVMVLPDGPICSCGRRGHLEAIASGTAIARWVEEELASGARSNLPTNQKLSAREIAAAAQNGDDLARAALTRAGTYLGYALVNFLHIFNPTLVIFGGGVTRSGELLLKPMREAMQDRVISPQYLDRLTLTTAALGDEAGLMGALALARAHTEEKLIPSSHL